MSLTHSDFALTDQQLSRINRHIDEAATRHAEAGEDPPSGIVVKFAWAAGLGRSVAVYFDGSAEGCWIEDF